MPLADIIAPNAIIPVLRASSKKQALQDLAARAASLTGQNERSIFEILTQREKLGSTGVGSGIAIPHGKLAKLSKLFGLFARLERSKPCHHCRNENIRKRARASAAATSRSSRRR